MGDAPRRAPGPQGAPPPEDLTQQDRDGAHNSGGRGKPRRGAVPGVPTRARWPMARVGGVVLLVVCLAAPASLPGDKAPRTDRHGDPLPEGALARVGSVRLRHASAVGGLAFSPDGKVIATGGYDEAMYLWDARTGRELRRLRQIKGQVYAVAFSPDGRLVAASGGHNTIHLWDPATGREARR